MTKQNKYARIDKRLEIRIEEMSDKEIIKARISALKMAKGMPESKQQKAWSEIVERVGSTKNFMATKVFPMHEESIAVSPKSGLSKENILRDYVTLSKGEAENVQCNLNNERMNLNLKNKDQGYC